MSAVPGRDTLEARLQDDRGGARGGHGRGRAAGAGPDAGRPPRGAGPLRGPLRPAPRRAHPQGPGLPGRGPVQADLGAVRRLADARGAGGPAAPGPGPAAARRADEPPGPADAGLVRRVPAPLEQGAGARSPTTATSSTGRSTGWCRWRWRACAATRATTRTTSACAREEMVLLQAQAAEGGAAPRGAAGLHRPLRRQGHQGAAGAEPREDAGEAWRRCRSSRSGRR